MPAKAWIKRMHEKQGQEQRVLNKKFKAESAIQAVGF
jgi:hypothetical protein